MAELLSNPGFETAGGGDPDFWANWTEFKVGTSVWADEGVLVHGGSHAAKATTNNSALIYIHQDISVTAGTLYKFSFWTRGDGTYDGRYQVYDNDNAGDIIALTDTGVTGTSYVQKTVYFTAPAGCTSAKIALFGAFDTGVGAVAYFDDVSVEENPASGLTWLNVYDTSGNFKARIFEYRIDECSIRSNTFGILKFLIHQDATGRDQLVKGYWIEVYRDDDTVWSGIICYIRKSFDEAGDPTRFYEVVARSFEWLPYWRVVAPPAGEDYLEKDGPTDNVVVDDAVKFFVREQMEPGQVDDADRGMTGFSVEADDAEHASEKVLQARYEDNLGQLLAKWAAAYDFDWWVEADCPNATFVLRTKVPRRGTDKTASVVFTVGRHNLKALEYYEDDLDTGSLCYVGGPGEGKSQTVNTVYDGAEPTGWDRREKYLPAANAEHTNELDVVGHAWLDSFGDTLTGVRFELTDAEAARWPDDFDIGDLVTVYDSDFSVDKAAEIKEVNLTVDEDGQERVELLVGEPMPSKWSLLQAGLGPYSSFNDDSAPATPANLAVSTGHTRDADGHEFAYLDVSWDANAELDMAGYEVYWSIATKIMSIKTDEISIRLEPVTANAAYVVKVRAIDKAGNESAYTGTETGTTAQDTTAPDNPTGLATASRFKAIHLTWTKPVQKDLSHFEVWRNSSGVWAGATQIAEVKGEAYTDPVGLWDSTFYYALKSVDNTGNASSGMAFVVGNTDVTVPAAPSSLASTPGTVMDADGHIIPYIDLTWTDSATEDVQAHEVEIWYDLDDDADYTDEVPELHRCLGSPLRISPAPGDIDYRVRVRALDDAQLPSAWTAYDTGTTSKDNVAPAATNPTVTAAKKAVRITWTKPTEGDYAYTEVYCSNVNPPTTKVAEERTTSFTYQTANYSVYYARLKHVDSSGNVSGYSTVDSATPEQVGGDAGDGDIAGGTIDTLDITNLAVTTAKIDNLAVTNAKIDTLAATKITAGTLDVTVLLEAASIQAGTITGVTMAASVSIGLVNGPTLQGSGAVLLISGTVFLYDDPTYYDLYLDSLYTQGFIANDGIVIVSSARELTNLIIDETTYANRLKLKESTTPADEAGYGKLYTKNDNKLYFQSGDGVEHEVAYA